MRHTKALIAAIIMAATARAAADPVIVHIKSDADCVSTKGSHFQLPPGYDLDEDTWRLRDTEYKRRGDAETRLSAENASLKKSASNSVSWTIVVSAVSAAFAAGYLLGK